MMDDEPLTLFHCDKKAEQLLADLIPHLSAAQKLINSACIEIFAAQMPAKKLVEAITHPLLIDQAVSIKNALSSIKLLA